MLAICPQRSGTGSQAVDAGYRTDIIAATDGGPGLLRAWLHGDWDIVAGGAIDDVYRKHVHLLRPFRVPASWIVFRAYDDRYSKPFSCGWWAVSDGTAGDGAPALPPGTFVRISERYGMIVAGGAIDDVYRKHVHLLRPFRVSASWIVFRAYDDGYSKPFSCGWWAVSDGTAGDDSPALPPGTFDEFRDCGIKQGRSGQRHTQEVLAGPSGADERYDCPTPAGGLSDLKTGE